MCQIAKYLLIVILSIAGSLGAIELLLRKTRILDQLNNPLPSYIPEHLFTQYKKIDKDGYVDKFGFRSNFKTDSLLDNLKKTTGCKVVVLGDSFVWGSGVPIIDSWPSQLQQITKCQIFPFGKPGWSSYQYLDFYEQHLRKLNFDFLILGIVANDPHPIGKLGQLKFQPNLYQRRTKKPINIDSNHLDELLIDDYINSVVGGYLNSKTNSTGSMNSPPIVSWGYNNWRNRLYEPDVFNLWRKSVLDSIMSIDHPTAALLTPTGNSQQEVTIFAQLSKVFKNNCIPFLNMMPELDRHFTYKIRPREAWANPSDGHPGKLQNSLYAAGALKLLSLLKKQDRTSKEVLNSKLECVD